MKTPEQKQADHKRRLSTLTALGFDAAKSKIILDLVFTSEWLDALSDEYKTDPVRLMMDLVIERANELVAVEGEVPLRDTSKVGHRIGNMLVEQYHAKLGVTDAITYKRNCLSRLAVEVQPNRVHAKGITKHKLPPKVAPRCDDKLGSISHIFDGI